MFAQLRIALTGTLLATGLAAADAAAQSYPISRCSGENCEIDYGPMGQATLVGGGRVMVSMPDGMSVRIVHLDTIFSQQPRPGFIPMSLGSGEESSIIYVPAAMLEMARRAMAGPAAR
ncbi:hypothetical protein [Falsiroseomonas sp.]|uniref:hypothetical protein n=1 Tax=Falsiroseomonas sp. TaxID=2870721 RepID=UPI003F708D05